jgi:hypothetical protein
MKNTLLFRFGKVISFPWREISNSLAMSSIRERGEFHISQIYLAGLSRKEIFDLSSTLLDDKIMIETELICGSEKSKVRISLLNILGEELGNFRSHLELQAYLYYTKSSVTLSKAKSSSNTLHFDFKTPVGEFFKQVTIEAFIGHCNLFPNETSEILYVGKTERQIIKRIKEHKKVFNLIEESNPSYSIRLYFASIELIATRPNVTHGCTIVKLLESTNKEDREIKIGLAEKLLVYYYQPKYNVTYKNWNFSEDKQIEYLKSACIERLGLDVGMESGTLYKFKSSQQISTSDEVYLNFDRIKKGFIPKWDLNVKDELKNYMPPSKTINFYKSFA